MELYFQLYLNGFFLYIFFNKPFISFERSNEDSRFNSLKVSLNINERIFKYNEQPDLNLLKKPLHINKNNFNILKKKIPINNRKINQSKKFF